MRRALAIVATAALALFLAGFGSAPQAAHAAPFGQCDSELNVADVGLDCTVEVVNNLDLSTGVTSSVVTSTRCEGSANTTLTCAAPVVSTSTQLITSVSQCNYSVDGGGTSMHCSVQVTNNITGAATAVPVTVNQCNGSLGGGGIVLRACDPDPATTSGAIITQCNDTDNGGGSSLTCLVSAGSTSSSALLVTVNQCNNSANGGGSLVVCSTGITTNILPTLVVPPTVVPPTAVPPATGVLPGVVRPDALADTGRPIEDAISPIPGLLLVGIGAALLVARRVRVGG